MFLKVYNVFLLESWSQDALVRCKIESFCLSSWSMVRDNSIIAILIVTIGAHFVEKALHAAQNNT
jgi:hypothetical protein